MQDVITRCLGLVSQYNPLNVAPGALIQADNCVINRENIVEDRRGYATLFSLSNTVNQLLVYSNSVIISNSSTLSWNNSGSQSDFNGSYSPPTSYKMKGVEAFNNLYITTSEGIKVAQSLSTSSGVVRSAGAPRALGAEVSLINSNGFLASTYQCAYRIVVKRTDSNSNVLLGYPSARIWIYNSAGASRNVRLTVLLPSEVTVDDTIQVYRTAQVTVGTDDQAGDEMQLVYQANPSSTDISNKYLQFDDVLIDDLRGAALYTSPSQEGIAQANDRPPLAKDIALYKNDFLIYANTSTKQRLFLTLIASSILGFKTTGDTTNTSTSVANVATTTGIVVGTKVYGTGIQAGTTVSNIVGSTVTLSLAATATNVGTTLYFVTPYTLTLGGTTYSFAQTEDSATGKVGVSMTGVTAVDIDLTARSLERVINKYATNTTVYAYYTSGADDLPGQLTIEERGIGASAFTIQVNNSAIQGQFFPPPPVSPSTNSASTSTNQVQRNAIYFSKSKQGECVPTLNYLLAGASNKNILRIFALRESLIIIKEEGVYRMTGDSSANFIITPLDLTVFCKAIDSCSLLANTVIMLSNQGVVQISDTGVTVISREIEPQIKPLLTSTNLASNTYGFGYESERTYFLSTITNASDTVADQTYLYNVFTKTWTRWTFGMSCAVVEPSSDNLYFAKPNGVILYRERKDFADTDYADPESSITIVSVSGNTVEFTISGATPDEGWVIAQGGTEIPIESISALSSSFIATMADTPPASWVAGAATIYPNVGMEIVWDSWTGGQGNASSLKQVSEIAILTDNIPGNNSATALTPTFASNFDEEREDVDLTVPGGGWGGAWGVIPWGGVGDPYGYRTFVPRNKQMLRVFNPGLKHKYARQKISVAGIGILYEVLSERIGR